jgi:transcription-repair coupling factor (superfamily II helicase)
MKLEIHTPPILSNEPSWTTFSRCPEAYELFKLAELYQAQPRSIIYVAEDDASMEMAVHLLKFLDDTIPTLCLPGWDCLPYDRVSPRIDIMAQRMATLAALHDGTKPHILLTTAAAFLQRVPPKSVFSKMLPALKVGQVIKSEDLAQLFARNGFLRVDTVREPGEFAIRGGIIDLFSSTLDNPVRLDLFGIQIESIHCFDPITQRRLEPIERVPLNFASELVIHEENRKHFLLEYQETFGDVARKDPIYNAIKEERMPQGVEQLLPLFYGEMPTILDYVQNPIIALPHQFLESFKSRSELILEYFEARQASLRFKDETPYRSLEPTKLYWPLEDCLNALKTQTIVHFSPFEATDLAKQYNCQGQSFLSELAPKDANPYDVFRDQLLKWNKSVCLLACYSEGSKTRLLQLLQEHGLSKLVTIDSWRQIRNVQKGSIALTTLDLSKGFLAPDFVIVTEQDLLGDRLTRPHRKQKRPDLIIHEASSLSPGDYVVHIDHGVGQFLDLVNIDAGGAAHDCLCIMYDQGDKLFIPVENIDVLSRFGSSEGAINLDRLGGAAWQARKAKVKERIKDIADKLLRIAAERHIRQAESYEILPSYKEFSARFPYAETDDQDRAIDETLNDLGEGKPMDRLICGDVGFGKTEIALRAAYVVASHGKQVAIIAPTTLLCRQHYQNFVKRFDGFHINVKQLSRFVTAQQKEKVKMQLANGDVQIVIGTHALLSKDIKFADLGLVIVDEEQHFGVAQKEKLKQLKSNVHVLTLTATPIPRTLQMALTGVRDLSIVATPPVDRLSVRTFVTPFDSVIIREAIMREHFRGGHVFYVCPRISDLDEVYDQLQELVPEISIAAAHGQMPTRELEQIMTEFYEGKYDLLLSTNIIESGIDIPTANTIIIHRSDMFGLSQLYQLRGRVGRSNQRGYAYLTLPVTGITDTARKRLEVMQTLDNLGAGFQLASYDMDIRGAGNLLGDEQSGHIREIGVELYQQMLEDAIHAAKAETSEQDQKIEEAWSPQVNYGVPVLIPEEYVSSLPLRMSLYRRISGLKSKEEIDGFAAELIDRFGPIPVEVANLLDIIEMKELCRKANIQKFDAGEKGAVIVFRNNEFKNPEQLIKYIQANFGKVRPDQSLFFIRPWNDMEARKLGVRKILREISDLLIV